MDDVAQRLDRAPTKPHRLAAVAQGRLVARTVRVRSLEGSTIDECYRLFDLLYEGTDRIRFDRDLSEKQMIILLSDPADGRVRGFSTISLDDVLHRGRPARLIYSGDTAIHPDYWGRKLLQSEFSRVLLREKLRYPVRPLLWFLISKGYKTYLLLVHHCPRSVPRVDQPADPDLEATLRVIAQRRFGGAYNPATGIISYESARERVRGEVAPIDHAVGSDPHVVFFTARNPGYERGDELACLAQVRPVDSLRTIARAWWHAHSGGRTFK